MTQKEILLSKLLDDPNREHVDIKFCRLNIQHGIDEERLCQEVNTVLFMRDHKLLTKHVDVADACLDVKTLQ